MPFLTGKKMIVIGGSRSGQDVEHPMAVVILGGLFTSTVLNVFLLPAIFLRFGNSGAGRDKAA